MSRLRCRTGNQDQININGPNVCYVQLHKIALGGSKGDVICKFPFPVTTIWIASKQGHTADSLYLHLNPMGRTYSNNSIPVDGSEQWFPMAYWTLAGTTLAVPILKFRRPVQTVYFEIGQQSGGGDYEILVAGANGDVDGMTVNAPGLGPL